MSTPSSTPTAETEISASVDKIFDEIYSLIKTEGKSFAVADIFNVVSATIQAVDSVFSTSDVSTKIIYVVDIVEEVLTKLTSDNVIPSEIGYIVKMIPLKLIVEFVMKFFVKSSATTATTATTTSVVPKPTLEKPEDILKHLSVKCFTGLKCDEGSC